MSDLASNVVQSVDMSTTYLGLRLRSPIVASASPISGDPDRWEELEAAGAGAIVLPSLFEEQIERESFAVDATLDLGADAFAESLSYLPALDDYDVGPACHLALVEQARSRLSIPVIASLNGTSPGGWVQYARHLENAGANAIELNIYDVIVDPLRSAADVETALPRSGRGGARRGEGAAGRQARAVVHLARPLRIGPAVGRCRRARAVQPPVPARHRPRHARCHTAPAAVDLAESRLPLHWIGILRGFMSCSLAATTGVHDGADAMKLLLAGADVAMTASAAADSRPAADRRDARLDAANG